MADEQKPVAWQWRYRTIGRTVGEWSDWQDGRMPVFYASQPMYEAEERPLYDRPWPPVWIEVDEDGNTRLRSIEIGYVQKLEAALEFYANPEIYKPHPHGPAFDRRDLSFHARAVLAKREGE